MLYICDGDVLDFVFPVCIVMRGLFRHADVVSLCLVCMFVDVHVLDLMMEVYKFLRVLYYG